MKRVSFFSWFVLHVVLFSTVFTGCRSTTVFDPYSVIFPEEEIVIEAVMMDEPELEADEEPRTRRRWSGRRSAAADPLEDGTETDRDLTIPNTELVNPDTLPDRYLLQVGDQLLIHITGSGLDEQLEMPVDENGEITLRFIGRILAAGRSLSQLEREIELEYTERQRIFREVFARVNVPYTFYFIGGEVRQPGRYPLSGRVTLSQAIVAAGNFTEWARRDGRLTLVRSNERTVLLFRDILEDPTRDIELRTGDVITVERSFL
jgi:polysaccharide export outer membrane protein